MSAHVTARIGHVALWVRDIDVVAEFHARHFGARVGARYVNSRRGFESRFLEFASGARLEIMSRADIAQRPDAEGLGYAHMALVVGNEAAVDEIAARLAAEGVRVVDGPRRTGDGYYECVVLDPEGNRVEITAG